MARSILADAPFEQVTFTWHQPGSGMVEDPWGNPIPDPGTEVEFRALFAPWKRPQLQLQPGADRVVVEGRGDLVEPLVFPEGVTKGTDLRVNYAGRSWVARLDTIIPNDLVGVNFGAYFECTLTPEGDAP